MKISITLIFSISAFAASPALSATYSSFSSYAAARFVVDSATFLDGSGDAFSALRRITYDDEQDSYKNIYCESSVYYSDDCANVSVDSDSLYRGYLGASWYDYPSAPPAVTSGLTFGLEADVSGSASTSGDPAWPYAEAGYSEYALPALYYGSTYCGRNCADGPPIELKFSYSLAVSVATNYSGRRQDLHARSDAEASIRFGTEDYDGNTQSIFVDGLFETSETSGKIPSRRSMTASGDLAIILRPGDLAFINLSVFDVGGSATVSPPSPVPLPAAAPLLLAGLGVMMLFGRRRQKSR